MSYSASSYPVLGMATQRRVRHIMSRTPVTISPDATLEQAAALMERRRISSLLVTEQGRAVGIITERDMIRVLGQGIEPDTPVSAIMTRELVSVREEDEVHAAYHTMALHGIRHLVVVDPQGQPVGIISETDFRKNRGLESFIGVIKVASAMSQQYLSMKESQTILDAAREMRQRKVSCVIAVDDEGRPMGIVTERDMVRLFRSQAAHVPLSEAMNRPVMGVSPDTPLADAVQQMQERNIRHLAVTDEAGRLLGVLTEYDMVRQLEDEYIQMLQQLVVQQAKALNEDKFRAVVNQLPHKILVKDRNFSYVSCNESFARDLGVRPEEIVGKSDFDFYPREMAELYRADDRRVVEEGITISVEEPSVKDGSKGWIHVTKTPMRDASGGITGVVGIFHDITERKRASDEMQRYAWALSALGACNKALVFAGSEEPLLGEICAAITSQDAYVLAWVGWADRNEQHSVTVAASSGSAREYLEGFPISWADDALGNGPTGRSIRFARTEICNDTNDNPTFAPWQERAARFGLHSSISLPFRIDGAVAGALVVYSRETQAFHAREVELFEELANNLGYGVTARRTRLAYEKSIAEREAQASKLEHALEDALTAIAATLEQRDPYTAGHERQVAELALRIGRELGLEQSRLRAIHLAGIVHDLGKIQVPAEILSKPGGLSPAEFALIKLHPEVGYNILKKIDFPWPIAEIIRQHHEYLDGSGYPRGLRGEEILLEARVLTVADIVESMSSDRPYRPALGLERAMAEIARMRGTRLDEEVVDACLKVLGRGEFTPAELNLGD